VRFTCWRALQVCVSRFSRSHSRIRSSTELCRTVIENYQRDPRRHPGHTIGSHGEKKSYDDVKVSTDLAIDTDGVWRAVYEPLHQAVSLVVASIAAQFPSLQVWPLRCTGYKIQHYRQNEGHFKWHFDALGPGAWDRQLAMVIFLNSVATGGETCFHRQSLKIRPVAGDALPIGNRSRRQPDSTRPRREASSVEYRQRPHFDALAGQYPQMAPVRERAMRRDASGSGWRGIEVLQEPGLIDGHIGGEVPALLRLVREVVDLAGPVRIAQLDIAQAVRSHARSVAEGERGIAQRPADRAPEIHLQVA